MKFCWWQYQASSGYNFIMLPAKILIKQINVAVLIKLKCNLNILGVDWSFTNSVNILKDLLLILHSVRLQIT